MPSIETNGSLEGIEVLGRGISALSFLPWRGVLLQGVTLRDPGGTPTEASGPVSGVDPFSREVFSRAAPVVVGMEQVHGSVVRSVDAPVSGEGGPGRDWLVLDGCDGLVTKSAGTLLTAMIADCVPVFLYDEEQGAIGLLHAGWKGTSERIVQRGIKKMREEYGTRVSELRIYLGPSIEKACYPVGKDVYDRFSRWTAGELAANDRRLDLRGINREQAVEMGVGEENIHISRYCTRCFEDMFYSYRASGGNCGRMIAFMGLGRYIPS